MRWTDEQDAVIRELGHKGVDAVRRELVRRCHALHTVYAIKRRAVRIHASLRKRTVCPECGAIGVHINRQSKMCIRCTELLRLEEAKAFEDLLEQERREAEEGEEIEQIRRERAKIRQRNARTCKRYGLPTKSQRKAVGGDTRKRSDTE